MKKINALLTCLTLIFAMTGVVAASANKKKRSTFSTAYYVGCTTGTYYSVTLDYNLFDDQGITTQAALKTSTGTYRALWKTQASGTPVKFVCP